MLKSGKDHMKHGPNRFLYTSSVDYGFTMRVPMGEVLALYHVLNG